MQSLDPNECDIYQLLPPRGTQPPGKCYSGTILIHWLLVTDTPSELLHPSHEVAEFKYKEGVLEKSTKNGPSYLWRILKCLPLGSASAIRPKDNIRFPGQELNERSTLIFSIIEDSLLGRAGWDQLTLLDHIPGVGKFFAERMSRLSWDIPTENIQQEAESWAELAKDTWLGFWYGFWEIHCKDIKEIDHVFIEYLRICTKAERPVIC